MLAWPCMTVRDSAYTSWEAPMVTLTMVALTDKLASPLWLHAWQTGRPRDRQIGSPQTDMQPANRLRSCPGGRMHGCRYRNFVRRVRLPEWVEPQGIQARTKDGVLTITIPKNEAARQQQVKEIPVTAE